MAQRLSAVFRDPCVQWTTGRYRHPPNTAEMGRSILAWGSLHERTEHLSGADLLAISPDVFGRPTKRADLLNRAIMLIFRLHKRPRCRQHKSPSEGEQVVAKTCSASCGGMRTPTRGRRLLRTHTHTHRLPTPRLVASIPRERPGWQFIGLVPPGHHTCTHGACRLSPPRFMSMCSPEPPIVGKQ